KGDWSVKRPNTEPSGWAFEYLNEFYQDIDDTAMVVLALGDVRGSVGAAHGGAGAHRAARRGVEWLIKHQEADGSWYGRWGVAYIYGTCFALRGLAAAGEDDREVHVLRAGEWLRSIQN